MKNHLHILVALAACGTATGPLWAKTQQLTCEVWHVRLDQLQDREFDIDFVANTCNKLPCAITDGEFRWQTRAMDAGMFDVILDRVRLEGTLSLSGKLEARFKNCRLTKQID